MTLDNLDKEPVALNYSVNIVFTPEFADKWDSSGVFYMSCEQLILCHI